MFNPLQTFLPCLIENTSHFIQVKFYSVTFYILQNEFSTCFHSQESCYYFFLSSLRKATPFQHLIRGMKGEWEAQQYLFSFTTGRLPLPLIFWPCIYAQKHSLKWWRICSQRPWKCEIVTYIFSSKHNLMNAKLSQQRFWLCHQNRLIQHDFNNSWEQR